MFKKLFKMLSNCIGTTGVRLKYGVESLHANSFDGITMAASEVMGAGGTYFLTLDSSGNAVKTGAASTTLFGHALCPSGETCSATAGTTKYACTADLTAIFRVPVGSGTYARTYRGKVCDLVVSSNVQKAAVATTTRSHLIILDGDETSANAFIIARMNPAVMIYS